jgi:hypothetical protein
MAADRTWGDVPIVTGPISTFLVALPHGVPTGLRAFHAMTVVHPVGTLFGFGATFCAAELEGRVIATTLNIT